MREGWEMVCRSDSKTRAENRARKKSSLCEVPGKIFNEELSRIVS